MCSVHYKSRQPSHNSQQSLQRLQNHSSASADACKCISHFPIPHELQELVATCSDQKNRLFAVTVAASPPRMVFPFKGSLEHIGKSQIEQYMMHDKQALEILSGHSEKHIVVALVCAYCLWQSRHAIKPWDKRTFYYRHLETGSVCQHCCQLLSKL